MKMFKDAIVLFLITVVAACALGAVYEITKGPIEESKTRAKTEAYEKVFGEIPDYNEVDAISGSTKTCDGVTAMLSDCLGGYTAYFQSVAGGAAPVAVSEEPAPVADSTNNVQPLN